jgi:ABC-type multidrug transport system permease subunit
MVVKDLRRRLRSPLAVLVILAFPVIFAVLIGLVFGSRGERIPKVHLLVENRDDGPAGNMLLSALDSNEAAEYFDVEVVGEEGTQRMEDGEASALLRIPENFSLDLLEGNPTSLELIRNPAQGILPEIAEQTASILVEVLDTGSHVLRKPLETIAPYTKEGAVRITDETVAAIAVAVNRLMAGAENYLDPPVIKLETTDLGSTGEEAGGQDDDSAENGTAAVFLYIFPGFSVYALFLVGDVGMRDLLTEGSAGTLRRQMSGPVTGPILVASKALYSLVLASVCLVILAVIGWIVAGHGVSLAGFLMLSGSLVIASTGAGAAVYGLSGKEQRGAVISALVYLVLAFAGGGFFDIRSLPGVVQGVAPVSPFYWGTMGYRSLLQADAGLMDVLPNAGILVAIGLPLLALGSILLERRIRRGGAS